ncbi:hypothetical protein GEMMAAP_00325 [Gemmatimonas phototrophica]|uniref:Uncharacterized protein n=1 Tax=Gemmatimonas phototrophica TaxID=1379270 RepID=A0A143BFB9_9BACT|nr:hypothetical protein GEMMAAP_00325 [Gemmatimonas phototrophica]
MEHASSPLSVRLTPPLALPCTPTRTRSCGILLAQPSWPPCSPARWPARRRRRPRPPSWATRPPSRPAG